MRAYAAELADLAPDAARALSVRAGAVPRHEGTMNAQLDLFASRVEDPAGEPGLRPRRQPCGGCPAVAMIYGRMYDGDAPVDLCAACAADIVRIRRAAGLHVPSGFGRGWCDGRAVQDLPWRSPRWTWRIWGAARRGRGLRQSGRGIVDADEARAGSDRAGCGGGCSPKDARPRVSQGPSPAFHRPSQPRRRSSRATGPMSTSAPGHRAAAPARARRTAPRGPGRWPRGTTRRRPSGPRRRGRLTRAPGPRACEDRPPHRRRERRSPAGGPPPSRVQCRRASARTAPLSRPDAHPRRTASGTPCRQTVGRRHDRSRHRVPRPGRGAPGSRVPVPRRPTRVADAALPGASGGSIRTHRRRPRRGARASRAWRAPRWAIASSPGAAWTCGCEGEHGAGQARGPGVGGVVCPGWSPPVCHCTRRGRGGRRRRVAHGATMRSRSGLLGGRFPGLGVPDDQASAPASPARRAASRAARRRGCHGGRPVATSRAGDAVPPTPT